MPPLGISLLTECLIQNKIRVGLQKFLFDYDTELKKTYNFDLKHELWSLVSFIKGSIYIFIPFILPFGKYDKAKQRKATPIQPNILFFSYVSGNRLKNNSTWSKLSRNQTLLTKTLSRCVKSYHLKPNLIKLAYPKNWSSNIWEDHKQNISLPTVLPCAL